MPKKPKFKPEVIRIILNPEQAILQCFCYATRYAIADYIWRGSGVGGHTLCGNNKATYSVKGYDSCTDPVPVANMMAVYGTADSNVNS